VQKPELNTGRSNVDEYGNRSLVWDRTHYQQPRIKEKRISVVYFET